MCCIWHKPAGVPIDAKWDEYIFNMTNYNRDGGGIMYDTTGGKLWYRKGLKEAALGEIIRHLLSVNYAGRMAVHVRHGTSGGYGPDMCHPFPVGDCDAGAMRALEGECDAAMMHNGVIPGLVGNGLSDSANLALAMGAIGLDRFGDDRIKAMLLSAIAYGKVLIYGPRGSVKVCGTWIESGGSFFSNNDYLSAAAVRAAYPDSGYRSCKRKKTAAIYDDVFDHEDGSLAGGTTP